MIWQQMIWRIQQSLTPRVRAIFVKLPSGERMLRVLNKVVWHIFPVVIPNPVLIQGFYLYWYRDEVVPEIRTGS